MGNQRMFNIGVYLVKFAWVVEILAVVIGFLISIIVSYSVFHELHRTNAEFNFGDYSNILVAGLPFMLVAVVEASKIPVATAMMYAKHRSWRILFFFGVILLALITFETMINGFERNFAMLTQAIDERKDDKMLIQNNIDNLEQQKKRIDVINPDKVEEAYTKKINNATYAYNQQVERQKKYIESQISSIDNSYKDKIDAELSALYDKERNIYDAWDQERVALQKRLRSLINQNIQGTTADKEKLTAELDALKAEMNQKLSEANFFTRPEIEKTYRKLIADKEARLYQVSDFATGTKALDQQTSTEQQLQEQLDAIGKGYQKRIDAVRERINYLNNQLKNQSVANETLMKKYHDELANFTKVAASNKNDIVQRVAAEKNGLFSEYQDIQTQIKALDAQIYDYKKQQTTVDHEINRLVNQNQIYRVAAYITNQEDATLVPKNVVGIVALLWFASLAFICSITGVFLAIAGIYMQKTYGTEEFNPR